MNLDGRSAELLSPSDEGLQQPGTTLSQIPTYVTDVPRGTEKVCNISMKKIGEPLKAFSGTLSSSRSRRD